MIITPADLKRWREQYGLTETELARRLGVTHNTVQNYESGALPVAIKQACAVWEDQFKKERADLGPVTLCYADGPMWVDPYRPRDRHPMLRREEYQTNSAALARVRMIWGDYGVHGPFIMERSGNPIWNHVELAGVVDGSDKNAPTVRNTIKRLADDILDRSEVVVREARMPTTEEVQARAGEIRAAGEALARLAEESELRPVSYGEFEVLLKHLHALGSYPTNRQVSDVAHAIHGEKICRTMGKDIAMSCTELGLRPASPGAVPCKICAEPSPVYGVVDLNRPCEIPGGVRPPPSSVPISYHRCAACGFLFTDAFDDWSHDQFRTHIYNDDYHLFDPDYQTARPTNNANVVADFWAAHKAGMRVLDFGGGNDVFCSILRARGFSEAVTYDPMVPEYSRHPNGKFDLVTCFETLEHLPDPLAGIAQIIACVAEPGAVLYSTLTQPLDFDKHGVSWWYVAPRNGHISIFTKQALALAWGRHGFRTVALDDSMHFAFRTLPEHWGLKLPTS
jgi:DNA-binding XRE family transcriptional regulator/SAM-dependent methyltransferase